MRRLLQHQLARTVVPVRWIAADAAAVIVVAHRVALHARVTEKLVVPAQGAVVLRAMVATMIAARAMLVQRVRVALMPTHQRSADRTGFMIR